MNRPLDTHEIMTLAEAAEYLRLPEAEVRVGVEAGEIPARRVRGERRLAKSVLLDWMRGEPDPTQELLRQAGTWRDDETLPDMLREIYKARGRPEDGELAR